MKKVIGIGGIFFKSKDPGKMKEWYRKHLASSRINMELRLHGGGLKIPNKQVIQFGPLFQNIRNILIPALCLI